MRVAPGCTVSHIRVIETIFEAEKINRLTHYERSAKQHQFTLHFVVWLFAFPLPSQSAIVS